MLSQAADWKMLADMCLKAQLKKNKLDYHNFITPLYAEDNQIQRYIALRNSCNISHIIYVMSPFKLFYQQVVFLLCGERRSYKIEIDWSKPMKKAQKKSAQGKLSNELICCLCGRIILVNLCIYKHMKVN